MRIFFHIYYNCVFFSFIQSRHCDTKITEVSKLQTNYSRVQLIVEVWRDTLARDINDTTYCIAKYNFSSIIFLAVRSVYVYECGKESAVMCVVSRIETEVEEKIAIANDIFFIPFL